MAHDDEVLRNIGAAWREMRRGALMPELRRLLYGVVGSTLEPAQVDALDVLASKPSQRMSDLAEALRVDASTATRAIERLEAAGLATRQPAAEDGRVVVATATEAGRRAHQELMERRLAALRVVLAGFSRDERATLASFLERLVAGIDAVVERERTGEGTAVAPR